MLTRAQSDGQRQARHLLLDQVPHFDGVDGQLGADDDAIRRVARLLDRVRVVVGQPVARRVGPPLVGLDGNDHIGVGPAHLGEPAVALAVLHQHVRDHQPEPPVGRGDGGVGGDGFGRVDPGVGGHPRGLVHRRHGESDEQHPLPRSRVAKHHDGDVGHQNHDRQPCDLHARKVEHPHPPLRRPVQRQHGSDDEDRRQGVEDDAERVHKGQGGAVPTGTAPARSSGPPGVTAP